MAEQVVTENSERLLQGERVNAIVSYIMSCDDEDNRSEFGGIFDIFSAGKGKAVVVGSSEVNKANVFEISLEIGLEFFPHICIRFIKELPVDFLIALKNDWIKLKNVRP